MINEDFFEGPVGDYCIARNTIKCLLLLLLLLLLSSSSPSSSILDAREKERHQTSCKCRCLHDVTSSQNITFSYMLVDFGLY